MAENATDEIIFLGSGGARIVVFKQIRASGGIWFTINDTNFLVDPGPGSLVRITQSKAKLDPTKLSAILLSHRHLDHAGDVNIIIEAITTGGTVKRGILFCPKDALEGDDPIVYHYLRPFLNEIVVLHEQGEYKFANIKFTTPIRHQHRSETYGFLFDTGRIKISYIADTRYFPELAKIYTSDLTIINVVRAKESELDHLAIPDAKKIISAMKPKVAILNHFGMTVIRAKPWELAAKLTEATGVKVLAAHDGMRFPLAEVYE
ncbi:MAG: MBL fold metallo-hydrolase [candidate division WOR-3 bacterium]